MAVRTKNPRFQTNRHIVILAVPPVLELDVIGPLTVFSFAARGERTRHAYRITLASASRNQIIHGDGGVRMLADCHYTAVPQPVDTLLIAGGSGARHFECDPGFRSWLNETNRKARRICSVCTGAFVLASTGLLNNKKVTTHSRWATELAKRHPDVLVNAQPIWIRDGKTYTSAGITAGIDLALALVEQDLGGEVALNIARTLVVFLRRPGGQSQFSVALEVENAASHSLLELQAWIADNLTKPLTVEVLAERMAMSPRNFARVFTSTMAATPARYVRRARLEAARRFLEQTERGLEEIARLCGFGSAEVMRRAFIQDLGISPGLYRARFKQN